MTQLVKQGYDELLAQTQQQQSFTNIYAVDVCRCLTIRNLYKAEIGHVGELNCRLRKARFKQKDTQNPCPHIYAPSSSIAATVFSALGRNLLQKVAGALVWHITASTAISIFATLYYFIANTQGASAVLDLTTVISLPTTTATTTTTTTTTEAITKILSLSSPAALHSFLTTSTPSTTASQGSNSITFNNHNISNINTNINSSSSNNNNYYSANIFLDLNYNINSTEMTISNSVSSLATNQPSGNSIHYNNNTTTTSSSNGHYNYNNVNTVPYNQTVGVNVSMDEIPDEDAVEYIFDRTDVRIIFITLYTMVFCCCFFGNLLVILVVTLSRRLRSITNFFLANLALADFCVGLFCVMQNLSIYLIDSWVFGEFLCRMYQFVHSLSYTASIFILVVICMERYFAIVHPITCKQILTAARLRMVILTVWITSAVYSTPKFVFSKTIKNVHTKSGREEEICVLDRKMFNSKLLDMINFGLLYVIPLLVMTVLYSKIAVALWRSSRGLQHHLAQQENSMGMHNSMYQHHHHHHHHHQQQQNHNHNHNNLQRQQQQPQQFHHQQQLLQQQQQQQPQNQMAAPLGTANSPNSSVVSASTLSRKQSCKYDAKRGVNISESQADSYEVSLAADRPVVSACRKTSFYQHSHNSHLTQLQQAAQSSAAGNNSRSHNQHHGLHGSQRVSHISHSSNNVLRARRGVVRMLIIFVLTFALCNLPYHARKMWQYWSRSYRGDTNFNALLTPLTFLVAYFNSGINPLLYAFLSRNFRKGMKELLMCSWRKSKTKSSTNSSMHHKRATLQTHSCPTDTTHIGNDQL